MTSEADSTVHPSGEISGPMRISSRKDLAKEHRPGGSKRRKAKRKQSQRPAEAVEPDEAPPEPPVDEPDCGDHEIDCLV